MNQIDKYILGELTSSESEVFRQQLLVDSELAYEVEKRKMIKSGLEALANQKMKLQVKKVRQEMLQEEKKGVIPLEKTKMISLRWLIAAAAIIVFGFVTWQLFNPSKETPQELFASKYLPYSINWSSRDSQESDLLQAEVFYEEKNYEFAIPLLEKFLKQQSNNSELELAIGSSYLSLGKIDKAMGHFKSIIARKDALFSDQAYWYLALAYLKNNEVAKSKESLEVLADDSKADFHKEAKELMAEL